MLNFSISFSTVMAARSSPASSIATRAALHQNRPVAVAQRVLHIVCDHEGAHALPRGEAGP